MNAQTGWKFITVLFVTGFVAACSSSGRLTVTQPKNGAIVPDKTVALLVEPGVENPTSTHEDVVARVRDRLYGKLVSEGVFKAVYAAPASADYDMNVKVTGAREVAGSLRVWFGAMAGANTVALSVQVHDRATEQLITAFEVTGTSAAHPMSSQNSLQDAVREAVDKIVYALR